MDFTLARGNPNPDLTGAVSPAWVHLRSLVLTNIHFEEFVPRPDLFWELQDCDIVPLLEMPGQLAVMCILLSYQLHSEVSGRTF